MRKESFQKIFIHACKLSVTHAVLFFYSLLLLLPLIAAYFFSPFILSPSKEDSLYLLEWKYFIPFFIMVSIFFILSVFGKGRMVLFLDYIEKQKIDPEKKRASLSLEIFSCALRLMCTFVILYAVDIILLSMPVIFFWVLSQELSNELCLLALATFFLTAFLLLVIEEFAFFYITLSKLKMRSALESSSKIFFQNSSLALTYSFLFFLTILIFTFCFNLGMLGITAVLQKFSIEFSGWFWSVAGILFASWIIIVKHAFYLTFFKNIATPEEDPLTPDGEVVFEPALKDFPPA